VRPGSWSCSLLAARCLLLLCGTVMAFCLTGTIKALQCNMESCLDWGPVELFSIGCLSLRCSRGALQPWRCRVAAVRYVIANDGSERTLAQLTLSLTDDSSPLKVSSTLCPPPHWLTAVPVLGPRLLVPACL
jgi:hypothetical protein